MKGNWDNELEYKKKIDKVQLEGIIGWCKNAYLIDHENKSDERDEALRTQLNGLLER